MRTVLGLGFFYIRFLVSHTLFLWRISLGGPSITFSDTDFITPTDPEALLPYFIAPSGKIVPFRSGRPSGGFYPGVVGLSCHLHAYDTQSCIGFTEANVRRIHSNRRPRLHTYRH